MGFERESRPTALGAIPSVQTAFEAFIAVRHSVQGLDAEGTYVHALERVLFSTRPQSEDDQRCQLRRFLLHLVQPGLGRHRRHLLSC